MQTQPTQCVFVQHTHLCKYAHTGMERDRECMQTGMRAHTSTAHTNTAPALTDVHEAAVVLDALHGTTLGLLLLVLLGHLCVRGEGRVCIWAGLQCEHTGTNTRAVTLPSILTLGACPRTLPARASEPCTLPAGKRERGREVGETAAGCRAHTTRLCTQCNTHSPMLENVD